MAAQDIFISRDYPIIGGYVQVPPNREANKNAITVAEAISDIPSATVVGLSQGSGRQTGRGFGRQSFLRLPGLNPGQSYLDLLSEDPTAVLDSGANIIP